ncbi:hypothetical protein Tco_0092446 [Tanacetum coccineum]
MHYPSWYNIEEMKKAHIQGRLVQHFDLERHMRSPQWSDIEFNIEAYFAKRYGDNKYNLKIVYWTVKASETRDVDAIRNRPPPNMEQSDWEAQITCWIDPKNVARAATNAQN